MEQLIVCFSILLQWVLTLSSSSQVDRDRYKEQSVPKTTTHSSNFDIPPLLQKVGFLHSKSGMSHEYICPSFVLTPIAITISPITEKQKERWYSAVLFRPHEEPSRQNRP